MIKYCQLLQLIRIICAFLYLHFNVNACAPCQIPPAPPRPDFDASREKLQKLGEGEGTMSKEEFQKMKQELEA